MKRTADFPPERAFRSRGSAGGPQQSSTSTVVCLIVKNIQSFQDIIWLARTLDLLIARKLIETRIPTVASPSYIKRHGQPKHPSEVAHLPCIDFYDAANACAFEWEFRNGAEVLPVKPSSRLMVSDVGAMLGACEAGAGIAQIMELGSKQIVDSGRLVELFPDWPGELFPLYALYPSRQHRAAKVRAFVDFAIGALTDTDAVTSR